ncbi:hypothetical protein AA18895_0510 [Acetobacter ghanensis DSM 18895]|nr:hypothetical protein AA18895_0510 [Acetobacter ghanensis DSM 18895]
MNVRIAQQEQTGTREVTFKTLTGYNNRQNEHDKHTDAVITGHHNILIQSKIGAQKKNFKP